MSPDTLVTTLRRDPALRSAVFGFVRAVPEIGARVGDRIVLRPDAPRPVVLQRELGPQDVSWCFSDHTSLLWSDPAMMEGLVRRIIREAFLPGPKAGTHPHLTILRQ